MSAHEGLKRQHTKIIFIPSEHEELISTQLDQSLKDQPKLAIIYEVLCIRLVALLNECKKDPQSNGLKQSLDQTLEEARTLNKQLLQLYRHTGNHKAAKEHLKKHAQKLRNLKKTRPSIPHAKKTAKSPPDFSNLSLVSQFFLLLHAIRAQINLKNIFRLLLARLRRFLLNIKTALDVFANNSLTFKRIFDPFDKYLFAPVMNYLSWLFLLPRLLANLTLLPWHVAQHSRLSEGEKKLSWKQRFLIQWRDRWFELANDLIWVPGGILTCFFLVGPLNMVGLILGVAMFGWDIVLSATRAAIELSKINELIDEHTLQLETLTDKRLVDKQSAFIEQLKIHRSHEIKRHALSITNNTLVMLLSFLAVSIISLPVVVPIIASSLLIVTTVVVFYLNAKINNDRPQSKLEELDMTSYEKIWDVIPAEVKDPPAPSPTPLPHFGSPSSSPSVSKLIHYANSTSSESFFQQNQSNSPI